jgi:hypothetical protein
MTPRNPTEGAGIIPPAFFVAGIVGALLILASSVIFARREQAAG